MTTVTTSSTRTENVPPFITLRTKGYIAYSALIIFAVLLSVFILYQKSVLFDQVDLLQNAYNAEGRLHLMDSHVNHIMAQYLSDDTINRLPEKNIRQIIQSLKANFSENIVRHLNDDPDILWLGKKLDKVTAELLKRNHNAITNSIKDLKKQISTMVNARKDFREDILKEFRDRSNYVAMSSLAFGLLGLTLFGLISGVFFTRLTSDILSLKKRAEEIVSGVRGEALPMQRNDEVGRLGDAVNYMAVSLEQHEKNLEIERRKYFHQEKMAAIGTVSAGIAHEVGNPIAAISALVREIKQDKLNGRFNSTDNQDVSKLDVILEHTERLSGVTREISEFARPQSKERELLDINSLITNTCKFMQYDRRWKKISMTMDLDDSIPAIEAVCDQITQVIMNILVNSADVLEDTSDSKPCINISTRTEEQFVIISIRDNGHGMSKEIQEKAQEIFFTTKASGKGTGLGLSLCHSIVKAHQGHLKIDSEYMKGTVVKIYLPLPEILIHEEKIHG